LSAWKLTVRNGPEVARLEFEDLDQAVAEVRRRAAEVRAEGPLDSVSMLRDFEPGERVHARLEVSGKGLLRAPTAGVDVMGDGRIVPFAGGLRRRELTPRRGGDAFDAVREELRSAQR
jgi:hypothetical protein